jgi:hypothetical protein
LELRDFIATPIIIILMYMVAYLIRPMVTNEDTRRYYFPALTLKIVGALALGFIYQFYYDGGDTFNYHTIGSRIMWEAFLDSPQKWFGMFFSNTGDYEAFYEYAHQIYFFRDPPSFFIVRLASVFDLITFSSYSATACFFAAISFYGGWLLFLTFYKRYPHLHGWMAFAILLVPSVIFWGSGILKDTIMLACLGCVTYAVDKLFIERKINLGYLVLLLICIYTLFEVRKFILQAFVPSVFLWIYYSRLMNIKSTMLQLIVFPSVIIFILLLSYFAFIKIGEGDSRYAAENLGKTAKTTAYDIAYYSGRGAGSTYSLGELDGTFAGMLKLAPAAINVALFRPYPWEVKNPLMALSAIESFCFLCLVLFIIFFRLPSLLQALKNQDVIFLLVFSLIFAFATGISSYNFGTLSRYKVSLIPYFAVAIIIILNSKKSRDAHL